jgi:hypothetical protein
MSSSAALSSSDLRIKKFLLSSGAVTTGVIELVILQRVVILITITLKDLNRTSNKYWAAYKKKQKIATTGT